MKHEQVDMNKIAEGLGAKRIGKVRSSGGYFGALQLAAEVSARFRSPPGGGRATNPAWTERRLVPFAPSTLSRLGELAERLHVSPLQVAAILLEKTVETVRDEDLSQLAVSAAGSRS